VTDVLSGPACPRCAQPLVSIGDAAPWCAECEFGLDELAPGGSRAFGVGWVDRWLYRRAYRTALAEFRASPERRPPGERAGVLAGGVLAYLIGLGLLGLGGWLCALDFPGPAIVPGVILILLAVQMRPRFGKLPKDVSTLPPGAAPALHALVARVAEATGAPVQHTIGLLDYDFNAMAGSYGLARRRVLLIGLPLWEALGPQERVALLGHEMGHFVNGDVRRSVLVEPMFGGLTALVSALRPHRDASWGLAGAPIFNALIAWGLAVPRWIFTGLLLVLHALAQRNGQRAEYRADVLSARAAGTRGAVDLLDVLLMMNTVRMLVLRDARAGVPTSEWPKTAAGAVAQARPQLALRRQLDLRRSVSVFASHPPTGLRAQLLAGRPAVSPLVVLDEATTAKIAAELARPVARSVRSLKAS
jgi:heat shock protein HtpX